MHGSSTYSCCDVYAMMPAWYHSMDIAIQQVYSSTGGMLSSLIWFLESCHIHRVCFYHHRFRLWYDGFAELFWEGASEVWTNKK